MSDLNPARPETAEVEAGAFEPDLRTEICTVATARRVAAMLDLDPDTIEAASPLPTGWHFILLGAETRRSALRADGYPGLGVALPDLGLPRLLATGRCVEYLGEIPVGAAVQRSSAILTLEHRNRGDRPSASVTVAHEIRVAGRSELAVAETQSFLMLAPGGGYKAGAGRRQAVTATHQKTLVPDEILLFQFSALGFNSHRIHSDKSYARDVEGYPDLVVNGGLITLLLTEFARNDLGLEARRLRMKNLAPLFCGQPVTLTADREGPRWRLRACDDHGRIAAEMELETR
ncbi:3-methylfumaryl-CoA hydratase [Rubrivivax sp. A210]|uniref:hypothetical protein n=1 Tax=Rubrivivax sp. A210 TaxID=2772301 RepID=UPI0019195F60|nr:hypothetical protein [Rubrivivax sp. A210]CAD5372766.1 3-methylfumaryl-CoA hydratase [Rubrivivax sp. A210]